MLHPAKRLRFRCALSALFLLFPGRALAAASGASGNSSDDVAVSLLVCLLLFLILVLFLAWRRLNRETDGKYQPWRLMGDLILRWQELWGETCAEQLSQGYQDEMQSDEDLGERQRDDEEEEKQKWQQLQQQAGSDEEEEERQVIIHESVDAELLQEAGMQEPSREEGASRATEGSAGALLSGLHSFSGTAAWEDSSKPLHVTPL